MSETTTSVEPKRRSTVSNTPITDAVYPRKGQEPSQPKTPRKPPRPHTVSVGAILLQKHGGQAYGRLLRALERVSS